MATEESVVGPSVEFTIVTVFVGAVVCKGTAPNDSDAGVTPTTTPVPLRLTLRGLPAASSTTVSVPGRLPVAVGVNDTSIVHVPPGASVAGASGHVVLDPYPALVAIDATVSGPSPVLRRVATFAGLVVPTATDPNPRLAGVSAATGAVPVPDKATVNGPPALVSTVRAPFREPVAIGANTTPMLQLAPAPTGPVQPFVTWKSPVTLAPVTVSVPPPVLDTVTV
jgi:hypothetical protein